MADKPLKLYARTHAEDGAETLTPVGKAHPGEVRKLLDLGLAEFVKGKVIMGGSSPSFDTHKITSVPPANPLPPKTVEKRFFVVSGPEDEKPDAFPGPPRRHRCKTLGELLQELEESVLAGRTTLIMDDPMNLSFGFIDHDENVWFKIGLSAFKAAKGCYEFSREFVAATGIDLEGALECLQSQESRRRLFTQGPPLPVSFDRSQREPLPEGLDPDVFMTEEARIAQDLYKKATTTAAEIIRTVRRLSHIPQLHTSKAKARIPVKGGALCIMGLPVESEEFGPPILVPGSALSILIRDESAKDSAWGHEYDNELDDLFKEESKKRPAKALPEEVYYMDHDGAVWRVLVGFARKVENAEPFIYPESGQNGRRFPGFTVLWGASEESLCPTAPIKTGTAVYVLRKPGGRLEMTTWEKGAFVIRVAVLDGDSYKMV